jgi:hypothetical protein
MPGGRRAQTALAVPDQHALITLAGRPAGTRDWPATDRGPVARAGRDAVVSGLTRSSETGRGSHRSGMPACRSCPSCRIRTCHPEGAIGTKDTAWLSAYLTMVIADISSR